ncbi:MAG: hypothetical protein ACOYM3_09445 [Terrimicrobiaceae bacterium]
MKQQKEMPVEINSPAPRYRYWFTPPETITLKAVDIEPFVPKASWKLPPPGDLTFDIPAEKVFSKNVPRIPLRLLAELLPNHLLSSDGMVKLPASRLAAAYHLVEHQEELPPEIIPEPELPPVPEVPPAPEPQITPAEPEETKEPTPVSAPASVSLPVLPEKKHSAFLGVSNLPAVVDPAPISGEPQMPAAPAQRPIIPARKYFPAPSVTIPTVSSGPAEALQAPSPLPVVTPVTPSVFPEITLPAVPSASAVSPTNHPASPAADLALSAEKPEAPLPEVTPPPVSPPQIIPPLHPPAAEAASVASSKFPPRRTGSFVGLPIFRRRAAAPVAPIIPAAPEATPEPVEPPVAVVPAEVPSAELPAANQPPKTVIPVVVVPEPSIPLPTSPIPPAVEPAPSLSSTPELSVEEPAQPAPLSEPAAPPAVAVRMLKTEHFSTPSPEGQEIVEQEPLQALFLTEEPMSVRRVIELCGGLPGINSCVLAHGSVVVASHNVPDTVDLVSMSAHAAEMLRSMRDSSARMGVGTVPAVTLHTEKGVISFFNREDLTLLVFHKDRGFVPGVREKMAAVLGELTKARLTLPVGGEDA